MTAQPVERLWTLDQALLWYTTRDMDLVHAASRQLLPEKRLAWMDWVLSSAEPMPEEDAGFRRARRLEGITDPEPEAESDSAVPWRVTAQGLHDLLAENPTFLVLKGKPPGEEWFEYGEFGYGRDGAHLMRAQSAVSYRGITDGNGLETKAFLVKSSELMSLLEASQSPILPHVDVKLKPARRSRMSDYARELIGKAFPDGFPKPGEGKRAEVLRAVHAQAVKGDKRPEPSDDTIMRCLGWQD